MPLFRAEAPQENAEHLARLTDFLLNPVSIAGVVSSTVTFGAISNLIKSNLAAAGLTEGLSDITLTLGVSTELLNRYNMRKLERHEGRNQIPDELADLFDGCFEECTRAFEAGERKAWIVTEPGKDPAVISSIDMMRLRNDMELSTTPLLEVTPEFLPRWETDEPVVRTVTLKRTVGGRLEGAHAMICADIETRSGGIELTVRKSRSFKDGREYEELTEMEAMPPSPGKDARHKKGGLWKTRLLGSSE